MAKYGKFGKSTQSNSEKIMYKNFMVGKSDELIYGGKVFRETPMH
jgi:hypothetical protein